MSQLLAVDRLPYRLLSGWIAMVRAGVVWMLLCLPVVTAPAATVVLLHTVSRVTSGEGSPGIAASWRMVRAQLAPALRLAGLVGLGSAVTASAVLGPLPGGMWRLVLPAIILPVAATWVLACHWCLVPLMDGADGALAALRLSYLRAIRRPDLAAASALGTVALPVVGLHLPTGFWLPFWLTVPSVWAALVTVTYRRAAPAVPGQRRTPSEEEVSR